MADDLTNRITVRFNDSDFARVQDAAGEDEQSCAEYVRECVMSALGQPSGRQVILKELRILRAYIAVVFNTHDKQLTVHVMNQLLEDARKLAGGTQ